MLAAAAAVLLVDEGRLSLDDPIVWWLPEVRFTDPALTPEVTVHDLLTHRTGLPPTDFTVFAQGMPLAMQISLLEQVEPVASPRARPHNEAGDVLRDIDYSFLPDMDNAAGSVCSTVSDMMTWAQFRLAGGATADGPRLISEAAIAETFQPQNLIDPDRFDRGTD